MDYHLRDLDTLKALTGILAMVGERSTYPVAGLGNMGRGLKGQAIIYSVYKNIIIKKYLLMPTNRLECGITYITCSSTWKGNKYHLTVPDWDFK